MPQPNTRNKATHRPAMHVDNTTAAVAAVAHSESKRTSAYAPTTLTAGVPQPSALTSAMILATALLTRLASVESVSMTQRAPLGLEGEPVPTSPAMKAIHSSFFALASSSSSAKAVTVAEVKTSTALSVTALTGAPVERPSSSVSILAVAFRKISEVLSRMTSAAALHLWQVSAVTYASANASEIAMASASARDFPKTVKDEPEPSAHSNYSVVVSHTGDSISRER